MINPGVVVNRPPAEKGQGTIDDCIEGGNGYIIRAGGGGEGRPCYGYIII